MELMSFTLLSESQWLHEAHQLNCHTTPPFYPRYAAFPDGAVTLELFERLAIAAPHPHARTRLHRGAGAPERHKDYALQRSDLRASPTDRGRWTRLGRRARLRDTLQPAARALLDVGIVRLCALTVVPVLRLRLDVDRRRTLHHHEREIPDSPGLSGKILDR
jgi:hypothetical protein